MNKKDIAHNPNYLDQTLNQEFLDDDKFDLDFAPPNDADFSPPLKNEFWDELNDMPIQQDGMGGSIPPPPNGFGGPIPPPPSGFGGPIPPPPMGFGGIPEPPR